MSAHLLLAHFLLNSQADEEAVVSDLLAHFQHIFIQRPGSMQPHDLQGLCTAGMDMITCDFAAMYSSSPKQQV